ncbi:MAG: hypothetical protein NT007_00225 [Candidatus Kapabacteria bacterium]|nr:hypothetical protein [Candidatus Kapabacteria bacterium]
MATSLKESGQQSSNDSKNTQVTRNTSKIAQLPCPSYSALGGSSFS